MTPFATFARPALLAVACCDHCDCSNSDIAHMKSLPLNILILL